MKLTETDAVALRSGLTYRTALGLIYACVVFMPAVLFSVLVSGIAMAGLSFPLIGYLVAFIFVELARLSGHSLTKQEVFILWSVSLTASGDVISLMIFQNFYLRSLTPLTYSFLAPNGQPLPLAIPDWWAPQPSSTVIFNRTFFHPDWILPIAISVTAYFACAKMVSPALGFLCYQLFAVEEKLPFPTQVIAADMVTTMTEREPTKIRLLMISSLVASAYAILLYMVSFVTEFSVTFFPIPWTDYNRIIELNFPGASFGVGTDLINFALGLILPLNIVLSILAGSFACYFVGNHLLYLNGLFPDWRPGMNIQWAFQRSVLGFWAFPQVGLALSAALIPILLRLNTLKKALTTLWRFSGESRRVGLMSLKYILAIYVAGSSIMTVLCAWLTQVPLAIIVGIAFGWGFLSSLVLGRALAETGFYVPIPYVNETIYLLSGYPRLDIWFQPLIVDGGGSWWSGWMKVASLTETNIMSFVKAHYMILPLAWLLSFLYLQLFWMIAPIPSIMYPAVDIYWPVTVITRGLWITGQVGYGQAPMLILGSFGLGTVIVLICNFLRLPFSLISAVVGMLTPIPIVITTLAGGVTGIVLAWKFGKERWMRYKASIAAGMFLGEALVIAVSVALLMVKKSAWVLPF